MKKLDRRASTLLLLGWCAGLTTVPAVADERSGTTNACRQETKRVVVWPPGPKAATMTRFDKREVCDAKVSQQSGSGK